MVKLDGGIEECKHQAWSLTPVVHGGCFIVYNDTRGKTEASRHKGRQEVRNEVNFYGGGRKP